jgi:hypothetical protein
MNILSHNYDVIILTETWLCPDIANNEFIDPRYVVFRSDRDRVGSGRGVGGGALVAVLREHGAAACAPLPAPPGRPGLSPLVDNVIVELPIGPHHRHIISAVYIPPQQPTLTYEVHFEQLQALFLQTSIKSYWVVGDYNYSSLVWHDSGNYLTLWPDDNLSTHNKCLIDFMALFNLKQYNTYKNARSKILDLFLTDTYSTDLTCALAPIALVPPDAHHPPYYLVTNFPIQNHKSSFPITKYKHCFNKADYIKINNDIKTIPWSDLLTSLSAECAVSLFYERIYTIVKNNVPYKKTQSDKFPCWFSPALIHIFKNKNQAWVKWKKYQNLIDYEVFSKFRDRFKSESTKCYNRYLERTEDSIHGNIKYFWTYISNRTHSTDMPNVMSYNNITSSNSTQICNMFSEFFQSVYQPSTVTDDYDIPENNPTSNINIHNLHVTTGHISDELKILDLSKGQGPDNIPPIFLKNTVKTITVPLAILFNKCLTEGIFPRIWKTANIVPVHKGESKTKVENYRPISILSTLSKVFEKLVHKQIYPNLHNQISSNQHGFVQHRSTTTNLLVYTTYLFENLDNNVQVDSVYTDFRKAFDRVDHRLLLEKIAYNGIRGNLWRWFKSYITNRTQKVAINGHESYATSVSSGVPQGSILGPLLFTIFINDINNCFQFCNFLLYADDLKIYHRIRNKNDAERFQRDLDRFSDYCSVNKLELNLDKCKFIKFTKKRLPIHSSYYLCNANLTEVQFIRDLGITLDSKLHLDLHVSSIVSKAYKMYGFVMRSSTEFRRPSTYLQLYKSLIRPQLEYTVAVWNPYYKKYSDIIEAVQKKFLNTMNYRCYRNRLPYQQLLHKYTLIELSSRRMLLETIVLYGLCNNQFDCIALNNKLSYKVPNHCIQREARPHQLFVTGRCRTNAGERAPLRRLVYNNNVHFNHIDIFGFSISSYKKQIIEVLKNSIV